MATNHLRSTLPLYVSISSRPQKFLEESTLLTLRLQHFVNPNTQRVDYDLRQMRRPRTCGAFGASRISARRAQPVPRATCHIPKYRGDGIQVPSNPREVLGSPLPIKGRNHKNGSIVYVLCFERTAFLRTSILCLRAGKSRAATPPIGGAQISIHRHKTHRCGLQSERSHVRICWKKPRGLPRLFVRYEQYSCRKIG